MGKTKEKIGTVPADDLTYEQLKERVPADLKEQFEEIEAGIRLPELYYDRPFKNIFNANIHKDRVELLFRLIFGKEETVLSSLDGETVKRSVYSKGTILDLLAALGNGAYLDLEMQVAAQEFIPQRIEVYTSDLVMMQYTVCRGEKKDAIDFSTLKQTYFAVLMKESPRLFRNNRAFLHRKLSVTDSGIELPSLTNVVYIELDKCLRQWLSGTCPANLEELAVWLCAIADINNKKVAEAAWSNKTLKDIQNELELMGKDRKELENMLFDKYEASVRYSGLQQARREGKQEGLQEGLQKGLQKGRSDGELRVKIRLVRKALTKGLDDPEIMELYDIGNSDLKKMKKLLTIYPELSDAELADTLAGEKASV